MLFFISLACESSFSGIALAHTLTHSAKDAAGLGLSELRLDVQDHGSLLPGGAGSEEGKRGEEERVENMKVVMGMLVRSGLLKEDWLNSAGNPQKLSDSQHILEQLQNAFASMDLASALKQFESSVRQPGSSVGVRQVAQAAVKHLLPEQVSKLIPGALESSKSNIHTVLSTLLEPGNHTDASPAEKVQEAEKLWDMLDGLLIGTGWDDMTSSLSRSIIRQPMQLEEGSTDPVMQGKVVVNELIGNVMDRFVKSKSPSEMFQAFRVVSNAPLSKVPLESLIGSYAPSDVWKNLDSVLFSWPAIQMRISSPTFQNQLTEMHLRIFPDDPLIQQVHGAGTFSFLQEPSDDESADVIPEPAIDPRVSSFDSKFRPLIYFSLLLVVFGLTFIILGRRRDQMFGMNPEGCILLEGYIGVTATELLMQRFMCENKWVQEIVLTLLNVAMWIGVLYVVFGMNLASGIAVAESKHRPQLDLATVIKDYLTEKEETVSSHKDSTRRYSQSSPPPQSKSPSIDQDAATEANVLDEIDPASMLELGTSNNSTAPIVDNSNYFTQVTPEEKENFIRVLSKELELSGGDVDIDTLITLMKKILHIPKRDGQLIAKQFDADNSGRVSVLEVRSALTQSAPILRLLFQHVTDIYGGALLFLAGLVSLFGTNNTILAFLSVALLLPVMMAIRVVCAHASKQESQTQGAAADTSDDLLEDLFNRKFYKLTLILGCMFVCALAYHMLETCRDPVGMCENGAWPICVTSGFPPTHMQCSLSGEIECAWSDGTAGDTMAICPTEKVPFGKTDNHQFSKIMLAHKGDFLTHSIKSPVPANLMQTYSIGVAHGAEIQNILPEYQKFSLIKTLQDPNYAYAYAEANKFTTTQNVLQLLPNATLPNTTTPSVITSIALQLEESVINDNCDAASLAGEFQLKRNFPNITNADLRSMSYIPVIVPESSAHSNYRLCYKIETQTTWKAVPNAWVIVGDLAGCSNPDCSVSDFSDGLSSEFASCFYYSMIVQTTIGYGDILPLSKRARMLTTIQSMLMLMIAAV